MRTAYYLFIYIYFFFFDFVVDDAEAQHSREVEDVSVELS